MRTLWDAERSTGTRKEPRAAMPRLRAWLFRGPAGRAHVTEDVPPPSLVRVSAFHRVEADIFSEAEAVYVLADVRGVARREDVRVRVAHDILVIEAVFRGGAAPRRAAKEVLLPFAPRRGDVGIDLRNGILAVRIARGREARLHEEEEP